MNKYIYKVIIPVVNRDLALMLLDSISLNTIIPDKILIIDNSMEEKAFPVTGLPVEFIVSRGLRLGVNASLNLGVRNIGDCDYVAFLNDDIILKKQFFERNINVFERYSNCGVACPNTVDNLTDLRLNYQEEISLMKRREGWAMSFRMDLLKELPPIPNELITFCGDDWLWIQTYLRNYYWYKDINNIIYHKGGVAVNRLGARKYLRGEKKILNQIKQTIKKN